MLSATCGACPDGLVVEGVATDFSLSLTTAQVRITVRMLQVTWGRLWFSPGDSVFQTTYNWLVTN